MEKEMIEEAKEEDDRSSDEGLKLLLERVEEQMNVMTDLKNRLEQMMGYAQMTVCEPKSAYQADPQKESTLMADYILDENGRVTNIQFNLVKRL